MNIQDLIKNIEKQKAENDAQLSDPGMARLQEVAAMYDGEYKLVWSDELLKEIENRPNVPTHEVGITKLDALTGGFREQQLITLFGSTKHGKTQMGIFFIEKLEKLNPVLIPLEQSNEEIVDQRKSNGYTVPRFLSPRRLAARVTIDWIEERIVEGIAKYNSQFVVIDHLGYIDDFGEGAKYNRENHAYRIEMVMKELKNLAKRWNVIIVVMAHISQADEGHPPSLKDLKGSSSIAQESDLVISVWRRNRLSKKIRIYDDKTLVSVLANRRTGKNGNVGLVFDTETGSYHQEQAWVDAMESTASQENEADDAFNEW